MSVDQEQALTSAEAKAEVSGKKKLKIPKPLLLVGILLAVLVFEALASRAVVKKFFFAPPEVKKKVSEEKTEVGEFHLLGDLIINPAGSGGRRHLLVSVGVECHDPLVLEELKKRDPQIRDNLITLLAGQESPVLTDIRYRESIRQSLLKAINYHLKEGDVEKLYFVKYVFQ